MLRSLLAVGLAFGLAGSVAAATFTVVVPEPIVPQPPPAGVKVQPVSLTRLAANIAPGTPFEQDNQSPYFMVPCVPNGHLEQWKEANNRITALATFDRIFRDELKAAGFRAGGDPTNLFEDQNSADLQVGALITGLRIKTCNYVTLVKEFFDGSSAMDVEWQVYSVSQGKVLARITTHGGFVLKSQADQNPAPLISGVFADNTRRLVANEEFRKIAIAGSPAVSTTPLAGVNFQPARPGKVPLNVAANGVVSIFAGDGLGSGVLISQDGYILTNHHVAGDSGPVRVRWPDGSETVGQVLRSDRRRDVALIKTTPKTGALAIRHTPIPLGETVFAIGTPLDKKLAGTLTRGVISGNRTLEGQPWIQSDVAVTHGNSGGPLIDENGAVVGLTDWGIAPDGASANLNFFVPIEDALRVLALIPNS